MLAECAGAEVPEGWGRGQRLWEEWGQLYGDKCGRTACRPEHALFFGL